MNALDKAFIKAYGLQAPAAGKMMPLSAALELSRDNESVSLAEKPKNTDSLAEEIVAEESIAEVSIVENVEHTPETATQFQPLLQVDSFTWPKACDRLDVVADDQLEAVADRVDTQAENGRKMIGFIGDQSGSGCTTLLLAVARRLSERCRVALVDANRDNPAISRGLGLLPDVGLKDVAAGRVPMNEALIESIDDRLTLLPYAGHAETEYGADANACSKDLRQLENHYDLVLVDLGASDFIRDDNSTLKQIDAAVIVRDTRGRRSNGAWHGTKILQAFGVDVIGIVENRTNGEHETRSASDPKNAQGEALAQDLASDEADEFYGAA